MKAVLGTIGQVVSKIVSGVHPSLVVSEEVLADVGIISDGQIVAKNGSGDLIAHVKTSGVDMTGTIDGTNDDFTATLSPVPILPGSVRIDNNNTSAQVIVDDGHGRLVGHGSGTVNYKTGAVVVALTTPPAVGKTVKIAHKTQPVGLNVGACDTAEDEAAKVLVHGAANADLILTGSSASDAEDVAALKAIGVFAV